MAQYSSGISLRVLYIMSDDLLHTLEAKLDELIQQCSRLQQENTELSRLKSEWQEERIRLTEKNELARTRVEAMILRLKSIATE